MRLTAQQEAASRFMFRRTTALQEAYNQFLDPTNQELGPYRPMLRVQFSIKHGHEINTYKEKFENLFADTDDEIQKTDFLKALIQLDHFLTEGTSDDCERYLQMGLKIKPDDALYNFSLGFLLSKRQQLRGIRPPDWDFTYIKYMRIGYENETDPIVKRDRWLNLQYSEAFRDYNTGVIKEIKNLVQLDKKPNDLKEARCEIYKISISYEYKRKLDLNFFSYTTYSMPHKVCHI